MLLMCQGWTFWTILFLPIHMFPFGLFLGQTISSWVSRMAD